MRTATTKIRVDSRVVRVAIDANASASALTAVLKAGSTCCSCAQFWRSFGRGCNSPPPPPPDLRWLHPRKYFTGAFQRPPPPSPGPGLRFPYSGLMSVMIFFTLIECVHINFHWHPFQQSNSSSSSNVYPKKKKKKNRIFELEGDKYSKSPETILQIV